MGHGFGADEVGVGRRVWIVRRAGQVLHHDERQACATGLEHVDEEERAIVRRDRLDRSTFADRHHSTMAGYTIDLSWPRKLNVPDGTSCVMKITIRSSAGSTQKIVDAAPPQ